MSGQSRIITFEGIRNARDLGGLTTTDGKTVRSGYLIRSANLWQATQSDIDKLSTVYKLRLIIDLRTTMGADGKPDASVPGAHHELFPIFDDAMVGITHESDRDYARRSKPMPDMRMLYRMMITEPVCLERFHDALTLIMSVEDGAALWHCSEGKDRCGLITLFLLSILHVEPDQILEDYLLTNETAHTRADYYYNEVMQNVGDEAVALSVRNAFIVRKEYLDSAIDAINEGYKDMQHFLLDGLKLSPEQMVRFADRMLIRDLQP